MSYFVRFLSTLIRPLTWAASFSIYLIAGLKQLLKNPFNLILNVIFYHPLPFSTFVRSTSQALWSLQRRRRRRSKECSKWIFNALCSVRRFLPVHNVFFSACLLDRFHLFICFWVYSYLYFNLYIFNLYFPQSLPWWVLVVVRTYGLNNFVCYLPALWGIVERHLAMAKPKKYRCWCKLYLINFQSSWTPFITSKC